MFVTLFGLFFFHGKQREVEREKRMQYWREQVCAISGTFTLPKLIVSVDRFPPEYPADERNRKKFNLVSGLCKRA